MEAYRQKKVAGMTLELSSMPLSPKNDNDTPRTAAQKAALVACNYKIHAKMTIDEF
jgi:hypothetical protein